MYTPYVHTKHGYYKFSLFLLGIIIRTQNVEEMRLIYFYHLTQYLYEAKFRNKIADY